MLAGILFRWVWDGSPNEQIAWGIYPGIARQYNITTEEPELREMDSMG